MDEIILKEYENQPVVSSREIADRFRKEHDKVCRDIQHLIESQPPKLAIELFYESEYVSDRGRTYKEYLMNRDGFSLLVMGFTGKSALEWKLKYINAFNQMEQSLKEQTEKALPTTYKEALIQLLEQVEHNEKLLEENKGLKPKAEYHDEVLNKDGLLTIGIIASDLGMSARALNALMYLNKIIYKQSRSWKPFADYEWLVTDGYADYQSYTNENATPQLKWTEKGRKWIVEHIPEWKNVA